MYTRLQLPRSLSVSFLLLFSLGLSPHTAPAAPDQPDSSKSAFLDLSIEELFDVAVYSRQLLGLHHTHPRGEWMLGYSYMHMEMDGNRDGTSNQSVTDVFNAGFMIAPTEMSMRMHMFEAMYGVTDDLTVMVMLPFKEISMDHINAAGATFTTESSGVGDLSITGLYSFFVRAEHRFHLTAGLHVPAGSTDERDATPLGPNQKLPYPMQLGSGTYDPVLGVTYLRTGERWSWGGHLSHLFRLGENSEGYTLGDRTKLDAWAARQWKEWITGTVRLHGEVWRDIDGADPELNPGMVPTADPARRGGQRLEFGVGTSLNMPEGPLSGGRLLIEVAYPIYQSLDGPQLQTEFRLNLGLQWAF